ncbi:MAG: glycosyltransferase family A protein [Nibricoccus sp.]
MSAWNAGPYLEPAIESILSQSWRDFEFIIVDDASTDGSREVIARWAARDARVIDLPNTTNVGASLSANRGIAAARAPWIARMDADDISKPDRLARQMAVVERQGDIGFITTLLETIDGKGQVTLPACKGICFEQELLPWYLLFYNRVGGHGQVMFRRDTFLKIGGYKENDRHAQDRELWPRLLREGSCVVIPEVLFQWRAANPSSVTNSLKFRYAGPSIEAGIAEVERMCGVSISHDEGVALRDFWLRFHGGAQDWDAVQKRLLELADKFTPVRPIADLRVRLRRSIACGWLSNALRAAGRRDVKLVRAHMRRAREAAGWSLPAAMAQLTHELARVGGKAARRL